MSSVPEPGSPPAGTPAPGSRAAGTHASDRDSGTYRADAATTVLFAVRAATEADLPAIADIAVASALDPSDSGRDPRYMRYLLRYGAVAIAATSSGDALGFAAAARVGDVTMLTDLFVRPAQQSAGAGRALLGAVLPATGRRMTFASKDPRAIGLYTRAGLRGRWALLYLRAASLTTPSREPGPADVAAIVPASGTITPDAAAAHELLWSGVDRGPAYSYWAAADGGTVIIAGDPAEPDAAGVIDRSGAVLHAAVSPRADPATAILAIVSAAAARGQARINLPSTHPAVPALLDSGFVIEDFDLFMASDDDIAADPRGAYAPGLF